MDVREKLVELLNRVQDNGQKTTHEAHSITVCVKRNEDIADNLIANGVTVQEQNGQGCPYCDIAKANEGVINTKLWVKEHETNKWTMMGKRLKFCPMCGRKLPQPPKGE